MKLKNKIKFTVVFSMLILSIMTISYARYVLNKSVDVNVYAPPLDAGTLNLFVENTENTYNVATKDQNITISSKVTLVNKYNIQYTSYYAWTTSNNAPDNKEYKEFKFNNNESEIVRENSGIGTYYLWVKVKYISETGEEKEIIKTSKMITVSLGDIKITIKDDSEFLTGDVIAQITYVGEYKYNTKAGYGKTEEEAIANSKSDTANSITIKREEIDTIYYIYAIAENLEGNKITSIFKIDNIDNIKPILNEVTPSFARVKINIADNKSGIKEYDVTTENVEPSKYANILDTYTSNLETYINNLKSNTTYYLWVKDAVGNVSSQEFKTLNLDYEITPNLNKWTNDKVTVKFCDLGEATLTYNFGGETNYPYNNITGIEIFENLTVKYVLQDGSNQIKGKIDITNIDKIAPTINITSDYDKLTIEGSDIGSGISGYFITNTEVTDITKVDFITVQKTNNLICDVTKDYLGKDLEYDQKYYVYVKDEVGNISMGEIISKIDVTKPTLEIKNISSKTNSITVEVLAEDTQSGLSGKYKYYIGTQEGKYDDTPIENVNTQYTFNNLEHNKTYYIKVETEDIAGRTSSVQTSIKTNELLINEENAEITFNNAFWSNNKQTVKLKTTTNYKMKYQIVKPNGTLEISNSYWSDAVSNGTLITGLEHGDILYVKLYDGTNNSTNWATFNVINAMKDKYQTLTEEQMQKITIADFNILTFSVNKSEIQVATSNDNVDTLTYNYYMKNAKTNTYELMMTSSIYNEKVIIAQSQEFQVYNTICVELSNDDQGTLTKSKNKTTTVANEAIGANTIADKNRTYIDSEFFTATVPKGFKVSNKSTENKIADGLVLQDENNNEFVWIPVQNAIYNETTTELSTTKNYTPMVRHQKGDTNSFEKILYTFNNMVGIGDITNANYRLGGEKDIEPSVITGSSKDKYTWNVSSPIGSLYDTIESNYKEILGFDTIHEFGSYLNSEYTNMITSVDQNGGFLIGRYETTISDEGKIESKIQGNILNDRNWYELYKLQNSNLSENNIYYNSRVVTASMITGSQYDAMLNFALQGKDKNKVTEIDASYGNKTGNIDKSGNHEDDKINNIYDLISNVYEETLESRSYSYRLARGGVYTANVVGKTLITKTEKMPTDKAKEYGSRMALYLLDSTDVTPPTFDVEINASTNSIKVNVTNIKDESNIGKYYYTISEPGDENSWNDEIITNTDSYTFENLNQSRQYYIRVRVSDEIGNISEYITKSINTNSMNISDNDIYISSFYGTNPNCVAILDMEKTYESAGYKIKYKVLESEKELDDTSNFDSSTWNIGNTINNLSDTNIILAKLMDSNGNEQDDYFVFYLDGYSEEFSNIYSKTQKYIDADGNVAYIPAGFSVGVSGRINTIEKGLVIQDENGNQFVWVPVDNAIKNPSTNITEQYTPMAMNQTGKNSKYYEGIFYLISNEGKFSYNLAQKIGSNGYREPSLVTINVNGSNIYTWDIENSIIKTENRDTSKMFYKTSSRYNSAEEFGKYINEEYYNMINSVDKYGGFYIARYETSKTGTDKTGVVISSVADKTPYASDTWYYMHYYHDSNRYSFNPYYNSKSVVSSMLWNSQYSAIVNWINKGNNKKILTDTNIGYHDKVANTGKTEGDIVNNIFDLSGNITETCMGVISNSSKITRGGNYAQKGGNIVAYKKQDAGTASIYQGTRMSLYIIDENDDVDPYLSEREDGIDKDGNKKYIEPYAKSNSIDVKVTAYDPDNTNGTIGSGIEKYVYSISSTTDENGKYINYKDYISYGNTYTYENLIQGTTYDMKVTVYDHSGKSTQIDLGTTMTTQYKIEKSTVFIDAIYGTNGNGTIYLDFDESFEEKNRYYIEYQIGKNGANYNENGKWLKTELKNPQTGVQINGLSIGDVVYARVTDGKNIFEINDGINNIGTSIYTFNITELEDYSKTYETKTNYLDSNKEIAIIPTGFAVNNLHNEIKDGLVIKRMKDNNGNAIIDGDEFVWVPVKNAIYDDKKKDELASSSNQEGIYKPMARKQGDYKTTDPNYYEGILYDYSVNYKTKSYVKSTESVLGNTTKNREVSLITGNNTQVGWKYIKNGGTLYDASEAYYKNILKFNSVNEFGEYMNNSYTAMINSVRQYGGFWVARYETSTSDKGKMQSISGKKALTTSWYNMYYCQESGINTDNPYYNNTDVASTMIFGSQWDAMLNWMITGNEGDKIFKVIGNHEGVVATTGKYGSDYINNIFDTSSNVRDVTQEADNTMYRVYRGGTYGMNGNTLSSDRSISATTTPSGIMGTRFTLYIK